MAADKTRAQNNQLQLTPGDIYFPCSLGSLPKEGTSSSAMSHVWRQSNTGHQARGAEEEELNEKSAMYTHRPRRLGYCGKASWGSQVHSINMAQKVFQDRWQNTGDELIQKLWELWRVRARLEQHPEKQGKKPTRGLSVKLYIYLVCGALGIFGLSTNRKEQ